MSMFREIARTRVGIDSDEQSEVTKEGDQQKDEKHGNVHEYECHRHKRTSLLGESGNVDVNDIVCNSSPTFNFFASFQTIITLYCCFHDGDCQQGPRRFQEL